MRTTLLTRALVALAITVGFVLGGMPAGADPGVDSGTITIGDFAFELGSSAGGCEGTAAFDIDFDGSSASGTWSASGTATTPYTIPWIGYIQTTTTVLASSVGTYTRTSSGPPATYDLAGHIDTDTVIQSFDASTCTGTDVCTVRARSILGWGEHTGTLPTPGSGDTTGLLADSSLTGGLNTVVVSSTCSATAASWFAGQPLTIDLSLLWP